MIQIREPAAALMLAKTFATTRSNARSMRTWPLLALLAACAAAPRTSAPVTKPQPLVVPEAPRRTPGVLAVARNLVLVGPNHDVLDSIQHAEVVGRGAGGVLRVRLPTGAIVEGTVQTGDEAGRRPPWGVGLYVAEDTPLLDGVGQRVGTAHRGAFVPIVRETVGFVEIELHDFSQTGGVYVALEALTDRDPGQPAPEHWERSVEHRSFDVVAGTQSFATACSAPVGLLGDVGARAKVAQAVAGLELEGLVRGRGESCGARMAYAGEEVAVGLRPVGPFPVRAFDRPRDFWLREEDGAAVGAAQCGRVRHLVSGGRHLFRNRTTYGGAGAEQTVVERTLALDGVSGSITAPTEIGAPTVSKRIIRQPAGQGHGIALCGWPHYTVVGQTEDAVILVPERQRNPVVAYHPGDALLWYTSRAACEADAIRTTATPTDRIALAGLSSDPCGH